MDKVLGGQLYVSGLVCNKVFLVFQFTIADEIDYFPYLLLSPSGSFF